MEYSYGRSDHRIEEKDFGPSYHDTLQAAGRQGSLTKQCIWILHFVQSLPEWLAARISPDLDLVIRLARVSFRRVSVANVYIASSNCIPQRVKEQIIQIKAEPKETYKNLAHPTLFHEILQSNLPDSDKSTMRLTDEAQIVVGAGTLTTSWTLSVAVYHLLASPPVLRKLKLELVAAIPDPNATVSLAELEKLPYLHAVIQEALRLSYGVSSRLQRISPHEPMLFTDSTNGKTWVIPPGYPVGMTSVLVHHDESIFPNSRAFDPERWIKNPRLDQFLVSFSKGSRQCLGINLAYAELYLCLSTIFRRFGSGGNNGVKFKDDEGVLELYETDLGDVEIEADGFLPLAREGSKGIRIRTGK